MTLRLPTTVDAIRAELDSRNPRGYLALSDLMEFDSPITVHEDGTVTDGPAGVYAPDLYDEELSGEGWEFFTYGYSGQDRYSGPIMHNSEFIGGNLARDILATPETYVAVAAYWPPTCLACGAGVIEGQDGKTHHEATGTQEDSGDWIDAEADADHDAEEDDDRIEGWAIARRV